MSTSCLKCGTELVSSWSFCPHCGTTLAHPAHSEPQQEHIPARGAFGGLFYGLIAAPILIFPGVMLCLLGWGIFLGIPMIVLGILAPLAGPLFGMSEHKGKCPACGTTVIGVADGKVHACPACNAEFAVEDRPLASAR
jgi:ribosomal protein L37AE/L43A